MIRSWKLAVNPSAEGRALPKIEEEIGSPNRLKDRTFRALFEMPIARFTNNLIKMGKNQYRNPIYLAKEWRKALDSGEYRSYSALARHLNVSRARVTQILNLLKLSSEASNK